jgi:hypothetical protein
MEKGNEILIGGKSYEIKLVKMKYIKNRFYTNYMIIKESGLIKTGNFSDGEGIILGFLTAILDSEELATEVYDNLDSKIMKEMLVMTKKLNELEDEPNPNAITPQE